MSNLTLEKASAQDGKVGAAAIRRPSRRKAKASNDGSRGDFFAVDYRAWQRACELGLNAAVAYLLLARGTLKDNRTTSWSVHATEGRTGISRPKAKIAIDKLVANGLVENLKSSPMRPKRRLVPGHLLPQLGQTCLPRSKKTAEFLSRLPLEASALTANEKELVNAQIIMGTIWYDGWQYRLVDQMDEKPDWIWLPNSLVDGAAGETPPVENLRQAQDIAPLRLLINLYHVHSLTFSAGVPSTLMWVSYGADEIAHQREFRVWDIWEAEAGAYVSGHAPFFLPFQLSAGGDLEVASRKLWEAVSVLRSLKYLSFVCHVFEGEGEDAGIIHPFATCYGGQVTEAEEKLYWAAQEAAIALLPDHLRIKHFEDSILPVYAHIRHVTAKGVARLHYRPKTLVTSQWMGRTRNWERWTALYSELRAKLPPVGPI